MKELKFKLTIKFYKVTYALGLLQRSWKQDWLIYKETSLLETVDLL